MALLSVAGEPALMYLADKLRNEGVRHAVFREPDIGNQITSICIEPSDKARSICAGMPLALKEFQSPDKLDKSTFKKSMQYEIDHNI